MKKRNLILPATLLFAFLFAAAIAKADVPFPTVASVDSAVNSAQDVQTSAVNTSALPMDPTLFAALIGVSGLILGCLITLSGAFVMARLNRRPSAARLPEQQIKEPPTTNKLIA